jgi:hypothetical protein
VINQPLKCLFYPAVPLRTLPLSTTILQLAGEFLDKQACNRNHNPRYKTKNHGPVAGFNHFFEIGMEPYR